MPYLFLLFLLFLLLTSTTISPSHAALETKKQTNIPGLACVRILSYTTKPVTLSQLIRRNQIAFFLASHFHLSLSLPSIRSPTGKNHADTFSNCGPKDDTEIPSSCIFRTEDFFYNLCPRGNCTCMGRQFEDSMQKFSSAGCNTVGVKNDAYDRLEFSGCLNVLERYLGGEKRPNKPYDAMYYPERMDELEAVIVLQMMCKMSEREIVIVGKGGRPMVRCGERLVVADVAEREMVEIFRHARVVGVVGREDVELLMEMARPERVVVVRRGARRLEWVRCEKWTVMDGSDASWHHYGRKETFVKVVTSSRDLVNERMYRKKSVFKLDKYEREIPGRRWEEGMMD